MERLNFDKLRINFDKAVDYIPIASAINSVIDLIQKRVFANKPTTESSYKKHIIDKTDKECWINMAPFGKIFNKILHRQKVDGFHESTQSSDSNQQTSLETSEASSIDIHKQIHGKTYEELSLLPMNQLMQFVSEKNESGLTPLQYQDNFQILLPLLLDKLSTEDLNRVMGRRVWDKMNEKVINSLSKQQCLRLTAIGSSTERIIDILPPFAQEYKSILDNYTETNLESSIALIKGIKGLKSREKLDAIAHLIEVKRIDIYTIQNRFPLPFLMSLAPHLRYIDLNRCSFDWVEDFLSQCSKVNILDCNKSELTSLPEGMTQLQELNCEGCFELTALPTKTPNLRSLNVSYSSINILPTEMPLIESLNCSFSAITALPDEMPLLKRLDCNHNNITNLPDEMPLIRTLDCNVTLITKLPANMPLLERLNISRTDISTLPHALPRCNYFDYTDCHLITEIPQLPFGAQVIHENAAEFSSLRVDFEKFSTKPRELLFELGKTLLGNQPFPNVIYYEGGQRNEAIDAGGVRRDLVTRLCENIFRKDQDEEVLGNFLKIGDDFIPLARGNLENEKESYQALGALLAYCYVESSGFKTGPLMSEEVYKRFQAPYEAHSDDWFLHNFLQSKFSEKLVNFIVTSQEKLDFEKSDAMNLTQLVEIESAISPDVLVYLLKRQRFLPKFTDDDLEYISMLIDSQNPVTLTNENVYEFIKNHKIELRAKAEEIVREYVSAHLVDIKQEMLEQAKNDQALQAVSWMAEQMQQKLSQTEWNELKALTPRALKDRIEGVLTLEALKESLRWDFTSSVNEEDRAKIQNFLLTWIDENSSLERLSLIVRAVTGNVTLNNKPLKIEVGKRGEDFIPTAHTCSYTLDLTSECNSQEMFNDKLEMLLDQVGFTAK